MSHLHAPALGAREVHVWTLPLDTGEQHAARCLAALPAADRHRALRFRPALVRQRWAVSRAAMRAVLGAYLGGDGHGLEFIDAGNGKPALAPREGAAAPWFNLSHSGGLALLAVTRVAAVGVDIERVRPIDDWQAIATRFFAPAERAVLDALPPARRQSAFFECWTRKEALLKATGEGIGVSLDQVAVSFADGGPPRILRVGGGLGDPSRWSLHALPVPAGYTGALAVHDAGPVGLVFRHGALQD